MTGQRGYGGDPFPPHAFIGPLSREMFERWLELFKETVNDLFVPEIADKFYSKADRLAEQFIENLGIDDEDGFALLSPKHLAGLPIDEIANLDKYHPKKEENSFVY